MVALAERLLAKYDIGDENECWPFTGYISPAGYGRIKVGDRALEAHRVIYELFVGPIPEGHELDHTCHNEDPDCVGGDSCPHRRCGNLDHLDAVTHQRNILNGKTVPAAHAIKTHCHLGHEFTPENTYVTPAGDRSCRACRRIADRKRRARLA